MLQNKTERISKKERVYEKRNKTTSLILMLAMLFTLGCGKTTKLTNITSDVKHEEDTVVKPKSNAIYYFSAAIVIATAGFLCKDKISSTYYRWLHELKPIPEEKLEKMPEKFSKPSPTIKEAYSLHPNLEKLMEKIPRSSQKDNRDISPGVFFALTGKDDFVYYIAEGWGRKESR
jgi:hypothetical protein